MLFSTILTRQSLSLHVYNTIRKLLSFFDFYHTRQITKQLTPTKNMFVLTVNRPHWHSVPNSGTKLVLYSF